MAIRCASLLFVLKGVLAVDDAPCSDTDLDGDETCALQLRSKSVNCGGSFASNCAQCPQGNGAAWCNGQCTWEHGQCVPKACCKAYNADCNACSAGVTLDVYCKANPSVPGCEPNEPCCMGNNAKCLSCAAGMTEEQYCGLHPNTPGCAAQDPSCALCTSCGNDFPMDGGRFTYFQEFSTTWWSYGEECSASLRERVPDNGVNFAPSLCCKQGNLGLLEKDASESNVSNASKDEGIVAVEVARRLDSEANASVTTGPGFCRLCDYCSNGYPYNVGSISYLNNNPSDRDYSQNFEGFTDGCGSGGASSSGIPPVASVCCMSSPGPSVSVCAVCQGSCGGQWPADKGTLSFTSEGTTLNFKGFGSQCTSYVQERTSYGSRGDSPRFCCQG